MALLFYRKARIVEEFKIYSVSDAYISYLREHEPNVYSNKEDNRTHTRKYVGIVIEMNGFPTMRITEKSNGVKELKGTLRISHMIPVPEAELILYDLDHEEDLDYKALVSAEIIFIRKNADKIRDNAQLLYKQKANNDETAGYVKSALNYTELERLCRQYSHEDM